MLKDLRLPTKIQKSNIDAEITYHLVDILFKHVLASIQYDRSSVKFNSFARGMIGSVLGQTRDGTKEYIAGMRKEDIGLLLDDIEKELNRRIK